MEPEVPPISKPPSARRLSPSLHLAAAMRLVSQDSPDLEAAGRRLLVTGPLYGIDLSLLWGIPDGSGGVRQVCLAVIGAGRTAMLFLSEPPSKQDALAGTAIGEDPSDAQQDRAECVHAACRGLLEQYGEKVQVAQALPHVRETWAIDAYQSAGLIGVGNLTYLRRPPQPVKVASTVLPEELEMLRYSRVPNGEDALLQSLRSSYEDTKDCPELCGLREPEDILESHRATGKFDPDLWWILRLRGTPSGCILLSQCPEQRRIELVYMGVGTELRGRGLSKPLLASAIREATRARPDWPVTCAVDDRNEPAKRLYDSLGFEAFEHRCALVRRLSQPRQLTIS
ncbi:MAG: GNAT family N-acetyltransferase [Phycisphaerales bacterium]